jgi:hypothetical protein
LFEGSRWDERIEANVRPLTERMFVESTAGSRGGRPQPARIRVDSIGAPNGSDCTRLRQL